MKKTKYVSEIFLASSHVSKDDWDKILLLISKYMGLFKKWELIVNIEMNEVRYYIASPKELPPTVGDMSEFAFKPSNDSLSLKYHKGLIHLVTVGSSIVDIYDKNEIKYYRKLKQIRFNFRLFRMEKYMFNIKCIFENLHNKQLVGRRVFLNLPSLILSTDYASGRFFYKKKPKYLDIQKSLHLLKGESSNSILKIDAFPYLQGDYYLNQNEYSFDKHSIIIGGSGTGKSKLISLLVNNLANNYEYQFKYKIIIVDPHAAIENDIGGLENTKVLNFLSADTSVDLFGSNNEDIIANVEMILTLFKTLLDSQYNAKIERMLRYVSYLLLVKNEFSFLNIRKLVLDTEYRLSLVKELSKALPDPVIDFFLNDFNDLKTKSYTETVSPIVSFIDELVLLPAFSSKEKVDDLTKVIKNNFLTIFSLDRSKFGEKATKTIVGLTLGKIMELIQSFTFDEHIILIIDEISTVESPIIARFLSEARKYNLSLILATQYFEQISQDLRHSIFANIANYYVFRVSKMDATLLEANLSIKITNSEGALNRINLLANLNDRECIVRVDSSGVVLPAIKAKTLDFISKPKKKIVISPVNNIVDVKHKDVTLKKPFNIKSEITLNDIMVEQSSSRKKVR